MTAKTIINYIVGGVAFAAGLTFYVLGTVTHDASYLQPAVWLMSLGAGWLGLQIQLPEKPQV